ncbi:HEAT repeat domain-containing protein [Streptomyces sp. ITFR-6]|uniref:HEAT repeat domain-containing protein n=1 Tax=Streptomyces sp. ITFR-6 TaxID=3075197 RepID=UPI00288BFB1A|nr:HEAT repeat domain-containing protein [Streptomyces sp. ITFR-6]WNI32864.1 HEAT repeat domain-containing protein [Streptomyces sp. ITFR-6]
MRTPAEEELHILGREIGQEDPGRRHTALVRLAGLVATPPPSDGETDVLAALLPQSLTGPPEADLLLARLYERLGHRLKGRPRPRWRTAGHLPVTVRVAWLRADVLHDPRVLRDETPGELLYQAVRELDISGTHRPGPLVDELADSGDPVLRAEALRLAREALRTGALAPAAVREKLIGLLAAAGAPVVADTLGALAEPWAATAPLPPGLLAPLLNPEPAGERPSVAEAALVAAARHGHRDLLLQVVEDPAPAPGLRRTAMELLGELAGRDDIGALTATAARDPLLLGGPAVTCLRGLHRRGHFPADAQVHTLLGLALADHSIPARDVATVLYTSRNEALKVLTDAPAADPGWPRRLALLVALAGQGAGDLPAGDAVTRVLPSAPSPVPFLDAIRALRHTDAEEAVIALLPAAPAAALDTLEAIGGEPTVRALREGLGIGTGSTAPHLRPVRGRALGLLWQLNRDPALRRALLARLDPVDLPPRVAAGLGGPDAAELALLSSHLDPDAPEAALCRLAAHGDATTLPVITDLLSRIVAGLAAARSPDAAPRTGEHGQPAGEPAVPQEVLDAISALGRRLHERGAIRPVCLLDATDAEEAGHALVASTALDLLDRPARTDDEQVVLLELLLRAPWTGTRARVHRLLRHRDRHIRKHVIALLAHDATGEDAQALSASLTALTRAQDIQTVRQALLALGQGRAHWASGAISACLDHPNMNIRKTAADALVGAGSPGAVPKLLSMLGHHGNPGLRESLVEALRAVLGDAYPATLVAAAEHSQDDATRRRLLAGLDGVLTAHSVRALDEQESPVAVPLLTLIASRQVALVTGSVAELAPAMAAHGITVRPATPWEVSGETDRDVEALATGRWDPVTALRLVARGERVGFANEDRLRPRLSDWLALAASQYTGSEYEGARDEGARDERGRDEHSAYPAARDRARGAEVLRFALALCSRPRSTPDLAALARSFPLLLDALADARDAYRNRLIAVLEEVAPLLAATARPAAVTAVRALAPAPAEPGRSTLTLLRRLGAILVRPDLDGALAEARLCADPSRAATDVLREAFAVPEQRPAAAPGSQAARAWRSGLADAVREPGALAEFRRTDDGSVSSRTRLAALTEAYDGAAPGVRSALVDWMTRLQPLDAPPWTLAETARAPEPAPRRVHADDLDQPRSAALRERLFTMLGSADAGRRQTAAQELARWPEPEARVAVLRAYLTGRIARSAAAGVGGALGAIGESELRGDAILRDRVAEAAEGLDPQERQQLVPLLLEWWEHTPPASAAAVTDALRAHPADALAEALGDRLDAGAWGFLDLLTGRPLLRTPALTRVRHRLRADGRDELADRIVLVDGPLRGPDAGRQDAAALAALRDRDAALPAATRRPRRELMDLAVTGAPEQVCRALTELAEAHNGPEPDRDPRLLGLLGELLTHPRPRVRLRAHRTARLMLDRTEYLRHTVRLLDDPRPDVVRMALRTLCRAGWEPAFPAVTGLLGHPHPTVRDAAAEALGGLGGAAVPALRHAAARARPDRRSLYTDLLDRIAAEER